ncbi:MAG: penicillin-binding protein 1C [Bauldia sp.]
MSARQRPRRLALAALALAVAVFVGGGMLAAFVAQIEAGLPPVKRAAELALSPVVLDRNGKLLRPFTVDNGLWRLPVTTADVDPKFVAMLTAFEDRRFFSHGGVDWGAMGRAVVQLVRSGRPISGGSTLTMQVARLLEGVETRTVGNKLRQMVHAAVLERSLSKDEILTLYLTLAPYGGNVEGIRAATLAYFGKEPNRLTSAEAALLVALPQAPGPRRPDRPKSTARAARDRVLDRMVTAGVIDAEEALAAKSDGVPVARKDFPILAAHLAEAAIQARPRQPVIRLALDRDLQAPLERLAASRAVAAGPKLSVAILVADHQSGAILASVGSPGFLADDRSGYVDMTKAIRSPGSTLKPLIYGLAFEQGLAHPDSLIEDRPTAFSTYVPVNFDGFSRGTVTVREALQQSLNIPAVVVLDAIGPATLVARLKRSGATPTLPAMTAPGLAIGLGGVGITLRDLVGAYAAIARGGTAVRLDDGVKTLPPAPEAPAPVLDGVAAWYVGSILSGVAPPSNGIPGRIAYKTGTSYGYRDAWAIGFDGRHVVGVWVGRPDGAPVPGLAGYVNAAPILFETFDRIGRRTVPLKAAPPGAIKVNSTNDLPAPLRRFRHPNEMLVARDPVPEIAFPPNGVRLDLGMGTANASPLTIKVRNGAPPFTYFANGVPIGRSDFGRSETYAPDGPGFVTLSVVDRAGRSARVTVFVE